MSPARPTPAARHKFPLPLLPGRVVPRGPYVTVGQRGQASPRLELGHRRVITHIHEIMGVWLPQTMPVANTAHAAPLTVQHTDPSRMLCGHEDMCPEIAVETRIGAPLGSDHR